jgi:hypothetical protein
VKLNANVKFVGRNSSRYLDKVFIPLERKGGHYFCDRKSIGLEKINNMVTEAVLPVFQLLSENSKKSFSKLKIRFKKV